MTPAERFELACHELGWGDAAGGLWFIEIEEYHGWQRGQEKLIEQYYGHGECFRSEYTARPSGLPEPESRSHIDIVQSKIASCCSSGQLGHDKFRAKIWKQDSLVAHANLYPLGKPRVSAVFPAHYELLFGYGSTRADMERYRADAARIRIPSLRAALCRFQPQAVVCMGWAERSRFADALDVDLERAKSHDVKWMLSCEPKQAAWPFGIVFTRHWASGFPDALASRIGELLNKQWRVTIP